MTTFRLMIWGLSDTGMAVARSALRKENINIVGVWLDNDAQRTEDLGVLLGNSTLSIKATRDADALMKIDADCVVVTTAASETADGLNALITSLLASGKNVIATIPDSTIQLDFEHIRAACKTGSATFHVTGVLPHVLLERFAMTLSKALQSVEHVRMTQSIDCSVAPAELWNGLSRLGLGTDEPTLDLSQQKSIMHAVAHNTVQQLYGDGVGEVRVESECQTIPAHTDIVFHGETISRGTTAATRITHRAFLDGHCFLTSEENWYLGSDYANHGTPPPYGNFNTPYRFAFEVSGVPSKLSGQLELESGHPDTNPLVHVIAQGVIAALDAVRDANPGILLHDAAPRYQQDDRMPHATETAASTSRSSQEKYRVVIWGPGEIGGAVTRAALLRDNIEIVGAKVFSPHKHGKDLGELVGIEPIGVKATRSSSDIKSLKPDCVIVTPQPRAIVEGLDNDVLDLLSSGINVITSAAYHNVTMPNWLVSSQTPWDLLQEVANTTGMAKNRNEEIAFALNRKLMGVTQKGFLKNVMQPAINRLLKSAIEKAMPFRATPESIRQACQHGNASLHGTGVHPTFMAERVGIQLANLLTDVQHMRFIECADFSYMPDGMWGGLETLGFGKPVEELDENYLIAKAGDFYYGDVTGNVAHLLFGVSSEHVRVERSFRAIPAKEDFMVGSRLIRKGHSAALHMTHRGYIGDHHFFTNEECWYLGPECEFRGDDLPFGNFNTPLSYTIEVNGKPDSLRFQLSMDGTGRAAELLGADTSSANQRCALGQQMRKEGVTNPITNATAMAILDAVGPVCDMAHGVIIDDIRPGFRMQHADA